MHRRVSPDGTPLEDGGWGCRMWHQDSRSSRALPTSAHAQRLAEWLLTIEVDWTKEHPSLPTDISGESVDKIARWVVSRCLRRQWNRSRTPRRRPEVMTMTQRKQ